MAVGTPVDIHRESQNVSAEVGTFGTFAFSGDSGVVGYVAVSSTVDTVTASLTTDGAMTEVSQVTTPFLGRTLTLFRFNEPTSATQSVDIDFGDFGPFADQVVIVTEVPSVDQTTPEDTAVTDSGDSVSSLSQSVTSATGDRVLQWVISGADPSWNQTQIGTDTQRGTTGEYIGAQHADGATSVTMTASSLSNQSASIWINVNDGGGGGSVVPIIMAHHG